jgi:formate hydrogenlyase subunit 3/multisubunit Na+/H+ antiporter MnhD subunit
MLAPISSFTLTAYLILLPVAFLISCTLQIFSNYRNEKFYAELTLKTLLLQGILGVLLFIMILTGHKPDLSLTLIPLPGLTNIQIAPSGIILLLLSVSLCYVTGVFSKQYLHREPGFARFYTLLTVFCYGMLVATNTSALEGIYVGWEIVGLTSFLLISFFYDREKSVHRAVRILAWYKLSDFFLLVAIAAHFGSSNSQTYQLITEICFCLAVLIKSAQAPFSYWLPWALEGPSPSSAVFYGGLGIHLGAIGLLIYTTDHPLSLLATILLATSAIVTLIFARFAQKIQPDAKSIIVYGVICQVSIIILEILAGYKILALVHIVGHAILRSYQILTVGGIVHEHPARDWRELNIIPALKLPRITDTRLANLLLLESSKEVHFVHWPLIWISNKSKNIVDWFYIFRRTTSTQIGLALQALDLILITLVLAAVFFSYMTLSTNVIGLYLVSSLLFGLAFILLYSTNGITYVGKSFFFFHLGLIATQLASSHSHSIGDIFVFDELLTLLIAFGGLLFVKHCLSKRFGKDFSDIHSGLISVCPEAGLCLFICLLSLSGFPGTLGALTEELLIHQLSTAPLFLFIIPFAYTALGWCGYRRFTDTFYGRCSVKNPDLYRLSKIEIVTLNIFSISTILIASLRML